MVVDPWAGSYMMETLTQQMVEAAWTIIEEVQALGGMTKAVDSGWAKLKIEAAAAEKQARIDSGKDVIVGVNKYRLTEHDEIDILAIDNVRVRDGQIQRLEKIRAERNRDAVEAALAALTKAAETKQGNLLELSVQAMRVRATVGEVSDALEQVYSRHRADLHKVSGVYAQAYDSAEGWEQLKGEIDAFAEEEGRRPRVMIAKLGQDGHDRGAKVVATAFADLGFDVDIGPLFQTPEECARQAIENDVHAVGVSTLAAGHKTLVPGIIEALKDQGADDIVVFVGGVVPQQDYGFLYDAGVKGDLRTRHADSGLCQGRAGANQAVVERVKPCMSSTKRQAEFVRWFRPLLDALRALGGSASPREALDRIAAAEHVPEQTRDTILKSGQEGFYNQVHWARQYLVWEGLIESGRRGVWSLTPAGQACMLTDQAAHEVFLRQVRLRASIRKTRGSADRRSAEEEAALADTPQADLDSSLGRFLEVIRQLSASGFERLCMRLLREAGFERVQVTGRANDGGIDGLGVLQINDLVSFNVVFQCKKWEQSVPPKEIRDLRGAMDGRADKGIFLTTSAFTVNARAEAERAGAVPVELVDGEKLFEMFKKYELGLKPRTVYDIDLPFFGPFRLT